MSPNFSLKFLDVVEDNSKIIEQTVKKIIMVEIDAAVIMIGLLLMMKLE